MKLVEQLAAYYRLSHQAEVQNPLCRLWLPQGEQRITYLRELFEPFAKPVRSEQRRERR